MQLVALTFYVPDSHLTAVKQALFIAGAGRLDLYDSCCWQTKGTGQFRPLEGSDPFLGATGALEQVDEWKVEMVCEESVLPDVIAALKKAHPYETPAYTAVRTISI